MRAALFAGTLILELLLTGSFLYSMRVPQKRIWPRGLAVVAILVGLAASMAGFFAVSLLDWNSGVFAHRSRLLVGGAFFTGGTLRAPWGVAALSFRTLAGLAGKLVTSGPYRWCRNPQYFGDFGVLLGWAILSNSALTWILARLRVFCFFPAAVCEEHDERYDEYRRRVPRLIGWPRRGQNVQCGETPGE